MTDMHPNSLDTFMHTLTRRISSLLQGSFAKETYNFIDPTNQSHPIRIPCTSVHFAYHTRTLTGEPPAFHAPQSTSHITRTYWRVHIPPSLEMSRAHIEFFRYHKRTLTREPTCCMRINTRRVWNENIDMLTKCTHTLSLEPTDFIIAHCRASTLISCTSIHFTFHTHKHTHTHTYTHTHTHALKCEPGYAARISIDLPSTTIVVCVYIHI